MCKRQEATAKLLLYRSIDLELRSMRNNIVIYGVTELLDRSQVAIHLGF